MKGKNYLKKSSFLRFFIILSFLTGFVWANEDKYENYPFPVVDFSSAYNEYGGLYNAPNTFNNYAFAALKADGSILTWGDSVNGGSGAPKDSGYIKIYSTRSAFAALKEDGSISAWGGSGGSGAPSDSGYTKIYSTSGAFAALKADGYISAWGFPSNGRNGAPTYSSYTKIYSSASAFATIKADGTITAWGGTGGDGEPTDSGYTKIYSTSGAFAALKADGSIRVWGNPFYGGSGAPSDKGYVKIVSNEKAFTAYKADGTIVSWGHPSNGGVAPSEKVAPLNSKQKLEILPANTNVNSGDKVNLTINIDKASNLYGTQATVLVDKPSLVNLSSITYGDIFDKNNRLEIPSEDSALSEASNDQFQIAISLKNPAPVISGSGVFANITYDIPSSAYGIVKINPSNVVFSDKQGSKLNIETFGATININNSLFIPNGGDFSGNVILPDNIAIDNMTLTLRNEKGDVYTVAVNVDGSFTIKDLKDGTYTIQLNQAPYYQCSTITIKDSQTLTLNNLKMANGDVNADGNVDIGDVTLIASNFGKKASELNSGNKAVNVNNDDIVNIQDLAIIGANFGMKKCQ